MTATSARSAPDLLVLHAVRLAGFAPGPVLADRFQLDRAATEEALGDHEARGWVSHTAFADSAGWSLTEAGRAENERQLAEELSAVDGGDAVRRVHAAFLPWNGEVQRACTDWQLRPTPADRLAPNRHDDQAWDGAVLDRLAAAEGALIPLIGRLAAVLARFEGYDRRFSAALALTRAGDPAWIDRTDVDSCHRVWFELHEDLLATLGLLRGQE